MKRIILAAVGAAITIATANPALACGGGGYAYRAPHHAKVAAVREIAKSAKPATPAALPETAEPVFSFPSAELPSESTRI